MVFAGFRSRSIGRMQRKCGRAAATKCGNSCPSSCCVIPMKGHWVERNVSGMFFFACFKRMFCFALITYVLGLPQWREIFVLVFCRTGLGWYVVFQAYNIISGKKSNTWCDVWKDMEITILKTYGYEKNTVILSNANSKFRGLWCGWCFSRHFQPFRTIEDRKLTKTSPLPKVPQRPTKRSSLSSLVGPPRRKPCRAVGCPSICHLATASPRSCWNPSWSTRRCWAEGLGAFLVFFFRMGFARYKRLKGVKRLRKGIAKMICKDIYHSICHNDGKNEAS